MHLQNIDTAFTWATTKPKMIDYVGNHCTIFPMCFFRPICREKWMCTCVYIHVTCIFINNICTWTCIAYNVHLQENWSGCQTIHFSASMLTSLRTFTIFFARLSCVQLQDSYLLCEKYTHCNTDNVQQHTVICLQKYRLIRRNRYCNTSLYTIQDAFCYVYRVLGKWHTHECNNRAWRISSEFLDFHTVFSL